jgi:hypothetical protein
MLCQNLKAISEELSEISVLIDKCTYIFIYIEEDIDEEVLSITRIFERNTAFVSIYIYIYYIISIV